MCLGILIVVTKTMVKFQKKKLMSEPPFLSIGRGFHPPPEKGFLNVDVYLLPNLDCTNDKNFIVSFRRNARARVVTISRICVL